GLGISLFVSCCGFTLEGAQNCIPDRCLALYVRGKAHLVGHFCATENRQLQPSAPLCLALIKMNRYQALIGWLSLSFLKNTFASIPAPQAILPGPSPNTNNTTCQIYPNTIESWNQLGVDQFLSDFPGGKDT
ncbi:hypothetical protein PTTG_25600, partial [Puccinia triticina 1-1 BBBD Race 1]